MQALELCKSPVAPFNPLEKNPSAMRVSLHLSPWIRPSTRSSAGQPHRRCLVPTYRAFNAFGSLSTVTH